MTSAWLASRPNFSRSQQQRREQYGMLKALGFSASWCGTLRDWRASKIRRFIASNPELLSSLAKRQSQ